MGSREHETNLVLANLNKPFEIFIRVALVGQQFSRSNIIDHGVYVGMTPTESISRIRQWPELYVLCHTFCTLREKCVRFSHVRVFSDSHNVQKRATKSDTSGHCLSLMHFLHTPAVFKTLAEATLL